MEKAVYKTDNFLLASYLLSEGCVLVSLDRSNSSRKVDFVFEEMPKRIELENKFLSYQASIEPNRLYASMRNLKQKIYSKQ
jgi:hypothetical protein